MKQFRWLVPAASVVTLAACAQQGGSRSSPPPEQLTQGQMHTLLVKACTQPSPFQCVEQPFTVTLIRQDGSRYRRRFDPPIPVIQHGVITVFAGQTLNIEAAVGQGGRLTNLKLVPKVIHPDSTLVIQFRQVSVPGEGKTGYQMWMTVHNPFDHPLRYEAGIRPLGAAEFEATDVCPVMARLAGIEIWPEPLFQVKLKNLQILGSKKVDLICR